MILMILIIGLALRILWTLAWLFVIPDPVDDIPEEWAAVSSGAEHIPRLMIAILPELTLINYISYKISRYKYLKDQDK